MARVVLQGSILDRLLFTLFMKDLPNIIIVRIYIPMTTAIYLSSKDPLEVHRRFLKQSLELWLARLNETG